jgi:hypothetical protein
MARAPLTFRQRDVTAAIKAAEAAGKEVFGVRIGRDGTIVLITAREAAPEDTAEADFKKWRAAHEP